MPIPGTKYKRSSSIFFVTSIALICARMCTQLLKPLAQSLIGSPGTLFRRDTLGDWRFFFTQTHAKRDGGRGVDESEGEGVSLPHHVEDSLAVCQYGNHRQKVSRAESHRSRRDTLGGGTFFSTLTQWKEEGRVGGGMQRENASESGSWIWREIDGACM